VIERGEHTPLWLSHHWPHDFDRCVDVGGRMVCRRCAVLYPVGLLAAVVLSVVGSWPAAIDPWLVGLLPLPAFLELAAEHLGWARPSAGRLVAVTVPLGVGCGGLYVRYLDDHGDPVPFAVVFGYGFACIAVVLWSARRRAGAPGIEPPQPLDEVARVGEHPRVVAPEARRGEHGQQREGEAERPPGEAEPRHR
jgi:hypothetical protein